MNGLRFLDHISIIHDHRQSWKISYSLTDILFLTVTAVIGGAEGWEEIEDFGEDHLDWLRLYGDFENGIPSHHTIARVMGMLSGKQLQKLFITWMQDCHTLTEGSVVAIDGKSLRGTYDKSKRDNVIHMVSAFSAENQVVLGQLKTATKSNEITAIPELLQLLELKGCIVTLDAMGCQRKIAQEIIRKKADYLLAVKGNQGKLADAFDNWYSPAMWTGEKYESYSTQEKGHGRQETRLSIVSHDLTPLGDLAYDWPELKTIGIVATIRQENGEAFDPKNFVLRYYISSAELSAKALLESTRAHWSIESQLHWRLDVAFREDECQITRGEAGENLAVCRHIAINLLTADKSFKAGIKRKQKRAGRNNEYLSQILMGCGLS